MKYAGVDHIVVTGRSRKPVYIAVLNDRVEIRDASNLWGKADTFETPVLIRRDLGEAETQALCIGKAGENVVRYASIITRLGNAAGRTGMGAVMGSKRLKAVAVCGTKGVKIADPEGFYEACVEARALMEKTGRFPEFSTVGTTPLIDSYGDTGVHVAGNFETTEWEGHQVSKGARFKDSHTSRKFGCFSCPIRCMDFYYLPEMGTAKVSCNMYGSINWRAKNTDQNTWWATVQQCQKYGIDPLSTAGILSWLMDLHERGIIDAHDTDGIAMRWGDHQSIVGMIEKIVARDGVGDVLAEGVKAAAHFGSRSEYYLYHVKGLPFYEINTLNFRGKMLASMIGPRGDHLRGGVNLENDMAQAVAYSKSPEELEAQRARLESRSVEVAGTPKAIYGSEYEGKAPLLVRNEEAVAVSDMLLHCKWHSPWQGLPIDVAWLARFMTLGTGRTWTVDELLLAGRRLRSLERAFDIREGLSPEDELPPKRFTEVGMPGKFPTEDVIDLDKFQAMKEEYFALRGWEPITGAPKRETLTTLGLETVAQDLERLGKLPVKSLIEVAV
jgi:aldehyde:ferredoxin oxidoreductase